MSSIRPGDSDVRGPAIGVAIQSRARPLRRPVSGAAKGEHLGDEEGGGARLILRRLTARGASSSASGREVSGSPHALHRSEGARWLADPGAVDPLAITHFTWASVKVRARRPGHCSRGRRTPMVPSAPITTPPCASAPHRRPPTRPGHGREATWACDTNPSAWLSELAAMMPGAR